jgi:hypothetical protein
MEAGIDFGLDKWGLIPGKAFLFTMMSKLIMQQPTDPPAQ